MHFSSTSTLSLLSIAVGLSLASTAQAAKPPAPDLSNSQFQQCLDGLKNSSKFRGVDSYTFNNYRPSQPDPSVIQSLNYQPEFQKDVWDYLSSLVDKERVEDGIRAKHQWADTLRRIESRYGVKAEHVLGVWGVESNFGQTLGKKPLFESLATLSCFDRRQSYFQGEYANALKIVQNGDIAPSDMTGSWAGAFGQTQFMPSTFLELAVDFDGDGRRDLVNSVPDALASTANFLDKRGYRTGEPWGYEVKLPSGFWGASNRKDKKSISHWRNQGLTLANGSPLPSTLGSAGLLLPAGTDGPAFLVGKNFDTFYSYNASENYALAIAHLSDLIAREDSSKTDFVTAWPTDDPG
ncbi:MAG: lytic murein transglycosylase, partial [Psychrobacter sp.]|nr:lytic murein transglycosylase [Psychrobacter sp.]